MAEQTAEDFLKEIKQKYQGTNYCTVNAELENRREQLRSAAEDLIRCIKVHNIKNQSLHVKLLESKLKETAIPFTPIQAATDIPDPKNFPKLDELKDVMAEIVDSIRCNTPPPQQQQQPPTPPPAPQSTSIRKRHISFGGSFFKAMRVEEGQPDEGSFRILSTNEPLKAYSRELENCLHCLVTSKPWRTVSTVGSTITSHAKKLSECLAGDKMIMNALKNCADPSQLKEGEIYFHHLPKKYVYEDEQRFVKACLFACIVYSTANEFSTETSCTIEMMVYAFFEGLPVLNQITPEFLEMKKIPEGHYIDERLQQIGFKQLRQRENDSTDSLKLPRTFTDLPVHPFLKCSTVDARYDKAAGKSHFTFTPNLCLDCGCAYHRARTDCGSKKGEVVRNICIDDLGDGKGRRFFKKGD